MSARADVIVVGGGPAGSTCARTLTSAGLDVLVVDRAVFPRDKPCAGWITPEVVSALRLDLADYASRRTLQPLSAFEAGVVGGPRLRADFDHVVSYAIRRCEFDTYLLERCGARVQQGTPVGRIERTAEGWHLEGVGRAPMLVGAGGHFCPVARLLNPSRNGSAVVTAQELEVPLAAGDVCPVAGHTPELYFSRDLEGYGWCVRKGAYLNVGFGHLGSRGLPGAVRAFHDHVRGLGRLPAGFPARWVGHAYHVYAWTGRRLCGDGVLLAGDAAGLAFPASGEGILPAVLSGQLAAQAILSARPVFTRERLKAYEAALVERFGRPGARARPALVPARVVAAAGRFAMRSSWFVRRVVVPRWFLHTTARATG